MACKATGENIIERTGKDGPHLPLAALSSRRSQGNPTLGPPSLERLPRVDQPVGRKDPADRREDEHQEWFVH